MAKTEAPAGLFVAKASGAESRHHTTNVAARAIMAAETREREAKTARLKALRMPKEAEAEAVVVVDKPAKAKKVVGKKKAG